jgi:SP family myo-inositol transporter-like MFS transporter 13
VIVASDFIFILGALLMGFAETSSQLIVGRSVVGVAIGVASIVVPVYIAEVSPKGIRAMLVVLYSLQIGVGLVLAFVGGFAFTLTSMGWRLILAAPAAPALLQLLSMTFLPESPRWLAHSGRLAEAEIVMRTLTAAPGATVDTDRPSAPPPGEEDTEAELREVYREGKYLRTPEGQDEAWNLRPRPIATQLAIGVGLSCLHSLAGARTIMYYSLEIISMAGFISELAMMQAIFTMGSFGTIGLMCGFFLIDRVGRRILALVSGVGTALCLFTLAASFSLAGQHSPASVNVPGVSDACPVPAGGAPINTCQACLAASCGYCSLPPGIPGQYHEFPGHCFAGVTPGNVSALEACSGLGGNMKLYTTGCPSGFGWMSMGALCLFQTFFQLGLGLIPAVVNAEYYPARVRGLCNGIAVSSNWMSNFFVSGTFLTLVAMLGTPITFSLYGGLVAIGTLLMAFYLPETSGLSFSEIQAMFEVYGTPGAPPVWRLHEGRPKVEKADRDKGFGVSGGGGGGGGHGGGHGGAGGGGGAGGKGCDFCGDASCDGRCRL